MIIRGAAAGVLAVVSAQSVSACMVPRDPELDRRDWMRIGGAYVETNSFDQPQTSTPLVLACPVGEAECSEKTEVTFSWTDTWRFGHIVAQNGQRLETYHLTDSVLSSCPEPEGPEGSAKGEFFVQKHPKTGLYYIHDWVGDLTSDEPTGAKRAKVAEPITIGEAYPLTTHGAERRINVLVPPGYRASDKAYPLVVMLDGGTEQDLFLQFGIHRWNQLWQRSEEAILVGVETVHRQRELLPLSANAEEARRYPDHGQADLFRAWLKDEVLPLVRAKYRHDGRAILVGESAAGHFVAETWVETPELFDGYAALSPSLQWDDQSLSEDPNLRDARQRPPLFLSLANEGGGTEEGALRFVASAADPVCFADRRASHVRHSNTMHQLLPEALQFLLPTKADWLEEYGLTARCQMTGPEGS